MNRLRLVQRYSTQRTPPKEVASAMIDFFPGSTPFVKSGSILAAASAAAFLISKEIYVLDVETVEMFCLFGAYYIWYSGGKQTLVDYFRDRLFFIYPFIQVNQLFDLITRKSQIVRVLEQAKTDHKSVVSERIQHLSKMDDIVPTTNSLYDVSKEIAQMEAEVYELKQKVMFKNEIKSTLDAWVRYEANVREEQQKELAKKVIEKVKASLLDPKFQNNILQQTLVDFEKIAKV